MVLWPVRVSWYLLWLVITYLTLLRYFKCSRFSRSHCKSNPLRTFQSCTILLPPPPPASPPLLYEGKIFFTTRRTGQSCSYISLVHSRVLFKRLSSRTSGANGRNYCQVDQCIALHGSHWPWNVLEKASCPWKVLQNWKIVGYPWKVLE